MKSPRLKELMKSLPIVLLSISVLAIAGCVKTYQDSKPQFYSFQLLAMTPMGLQPINNLIVSNVMRKSDGSICFKVKSSSENVCVKFPQYILSETTAE